VNEPVAEPSGSASPSASPRPFHPLLIAVFPILSLYAHNIDEVPVQAIWRPLVVALAASIAVWLLLALLARNGRKAALAASAIVLAFFSIGHVANLLPDRWHPAAAVVGVLTALTVLTLLLRWKGSLARTTLVVNLASCALIVPSCYTIGLHTVVRAFGGTRPASRGFIYTQEPARSAKAPRTVRPVAATVSATMQRPDIYYIILDAYGRADSLRAFYGYDNAPFIRALEQRGFYVAPKSRANYAQTAYCLPTSLNMRYLDDRVQADMPPEDRFEALRAMIDDNAVAEYLRGIGYHYVFVWTGAGITRNETADVELGADSVPPPSSFEGELLGLSALDAAPNDLQFGFGIAADYNRHRACLQSAFRNLAALPALPYPKFVFAHISAPHPPFVFGPNGEPVNPPYPYMDSDGSQLMRMHRVTRRDYQIGYVNQLRYVNSRVLESVDTIIRQSKRPPIIILQGDHGSRLNVDWESQARTDLREPFSILNAYYVPPRVRHRLYDSISPVNSFRILLSTLFGADYPVLPDRSFFAPAVQPLRFTEVTNSIGPLPGQPPSAVGRTGVPAR
jgi:hypothetical protein